MDDLFGVAITAHNLSTQTIIGLGEPGQMVKLLLTKHGTLDARPWGNTSHDEIAIGVLQQVPNDDWEISNRVAFIDDDVFSEILARVRTKHGMEKANAVSK